MGAEQQVIAGFNKTGGTFPTGLTVWARYKASDLVAVGDGGAVGTWTDKSGNGRDATQATASRKPLLRTAASGLVGNACAVDFQGDNTNPHVLALPSMAALTQGEIFVFFKLDADPPAVGSCMLFMGSGDSPSQYSIYPYQDGTIYDSFGSTVRKTTVNPTPSLTSWRNYNPRSSSGNWTSCLDNTQIFTTATNTVGFQSAPLIGGYPAGTTTLRLMNGKIAEIVILDTLTDSTGRAAMQSYFNAEYLGL